MSIVPDVLKVPDIAWEYWGWAHPPEGMAGLYGMDDRRSECHERLCKHYRLSRDTTKKVTDHLDKCEDAYDMHHALLRLRDNAPAHRESGEADGCREGAE